MPCSQIFGGQNSHLFFMSLSPLNKFIVYVELTDFKSVSVNSFFKYLSHCGLWSVTFWELFDAGTWQFHKKITNENTRKCWHNLRDWCFVINTAQLFCINDHNSYPINSTEGQPVILAFTSFCCFMKGVALFFSNSSFYNLSIDI